MDGIVHPGCPTSNDTIHSYCEDEEKRRLTRSGNRISVGFEPDVPIERGVIFIYWLHTYILNSNKTMTY